MANTRFLTTGIKAPGLGSPVPETMQTATMKSESEWEKSMKTIKQNLKKIKKLVKRSYPRRRRLPVWEDDEAWWWRRRRRSSMEDWAPNVLVFFESMQDEEEEEVEDEVEEEEADDELVEEEEVGEPTMELHSQNSVSEDIKVEDPVGESVEIKYDAMEEKVALSTQVEHEEEPPMKEGEEFATDVEYWVTSLPTRLLSPESPEPPMPPKSPDPLALGCWDLLTQLPSPEPPDPMSMEAHRSLATKLPPPRPPDQATAAARTERAVMRMAEVQATRVVVQRSLANSCANADQPLLESPEPREPPELPDLPDRNLYPTAAWTVVVKGRREVAVAAPILPCCSVRMEKGGGAGMTFRKLGPGFTLMGQAQNGFSIEVSVRKAKEAWMSLFSNSLGQVHLRERQDHDLEGVTGFTKFSTCVTHPFKSGSARPPLTILLC